MSLSDHDNADQTAVLTGFLFGNIDESGNLEEDFLDEECRRRIGCLAGFGIESFVKEIAGSNEEDNFDEVDDNFNHDGNDRGAGDSIVIPTCIDNFKKTGDEFSKSDDAVDYFDITEIADDDNYDIEEPKHELTIVTKSEPQQMQVLNTPLASLLPPQLAGEDVRKWFPEFRANQVLRFSRLFKPAHLPNIWKKKKKSNKDNLLSGDNHPNITAKSKEVESSKKAENSMKHIKHENQPTINNPQKTTAKKHKRKKRPKKFRPGNETADQENAKRRRKKKKRKKIKREDVAEDDYDDWEKNGFFKEEYIVQEKKPEVVYGRLPICDELAADDLEMLLQADRPQSALDGDGDRVNKPEIADWRYGPSRLWYDMLGVPEDGVGFHYGFQLKQPSSENASSAVDGLLKSEENERKVVQAEPSSSSSSVPPSSSSSSSSSAPKPSKQSVVIPEDAYYMITQSQWEDEIIWNGEDVKVKVMQNLKHRAARAGWIPTSNARTYEQFISQYEPNAKLNTGYSMFPVENEALVSGRWMEDIIWDAQAMDKLPEPSILTLDPDDENLILYIPDDNDVKQHKQQQQPQQQDGGGGVSGAGSNSKKEKESRKSKLLLGKAGIIKDEEDNTIQQEEPDICPKNPFNLSNDEYYNPKLTTDNALGRNMGGSVIQHSTPAIELRQPFFPCHLSILKLRNFHRPPLKKYSHGAMTSPGPHPVLPLIKQIRRKEKLREQERLASGGGEMFFMRTADDLTSRDGEVVLAEYSEQYPPLVNQIGMATKIKNYYKRRPGQETNPPEFKYGELAYAHTSPFLGALQPGQCVTAFENNMFRAPLYQHKMNGTDFLVIRNRHHYYIREVDAIFVVGQECPLVEVPGPNSKRANNFLRDFLQLFIYRLFWLSRDNPRRIKMEDIRKAFPSHSESSIRKRLKLCADFKRTGTDSNWWVWKRDCRLPSEEEMREMVSCEQCCAYYSMLAAEQRLKDAGYGEKSLFSNEEENEDDVQTKMEDEVKAAPWNTTCAYISAMKGKCLLALNGVADPTGCGEGFSYVKIPNKPQVGKDDQSNQPSIKRSVTGTDADLRRLPLKDAKNLLRKFGFDEATVKKLSRWEVINVVRTMSTEQAKSSQDGIGISKFARGNRFSVAEHHERYKEECQRLFDLQNKILGSDEVLSTDEDWSSADESDFEQMGKNIENMLSNKKTSHQIRMEREEAERRELSKMVKKGVKPGKKLNKKEQQSSVHTGIRKLKITRTFRGEDGREFTRTEIVKKANIIDTYIRIRQTKDASVIQQFSLLDEHQKDEMKKEKKRIQEQLRRLKRMDTNGSMDAMMVPSPSNHNNNNNNGSSLDMPVKKKMKLEDKFNKSQKLKCGACGQSGHMRTNRECPMFLKSLTPMGVVGSVALSEEQQQQLEREDLFDEELVNIEDTKVTLSKHLIKRAEEIKKKSLMLKIPKMLKEEKKKKMSSISLQDDYLKKPKKLFNRRRADPVVTLSTILENILNEMRELPISTQFLFPVNAKKVPDYYKIIKKPVDLQTIRENLRSRKYQSREAFLVDVNQIVRNCELYNGVKHPLTASAQKMLDYCLQRIAEKEEKLMRLEKAINPLLDDDDMVSLSYIITSIIEDRLKVIEGSVQFHTPVNKKQYKDYYDVIKQPIDLSTIHKKATDHRYHNHKEFLSDIELLVSNCLRYNGPLNPLTNTANVMLETCKAALVEQSGTLEALEQNIQATQEAALEAVDNESVVTGGTSVTGGDLDETMKPASKRGRKKNIKFSVGGDDDSNNNFNISNNNNSSNNNSNSSNNKGNNNSIMVGCSASNDDNNDDDNDDNDNSNLNVDDNDNDDRVVSVAKKRRMDNNETFDDVMVDIEGDEEDDDDEDDDNNADGGYGNDDDDNEDKRMNRGLLNVDDDNDDGGGGGGDNDFDAQEFFNSLVAQGENNNNNNNNNNNSNNNNNDDGDNDNDNDVTNEEIMRDVMKGDDEDEEDDEELMMIEGAASAHHDLENDLQLSDSEESDVNNNENDDDDDNDDDYGDNDNDNDNDRQYSSYNGGDNNIDNDGDDGGGGNNNDDDDDEEEANYYPDMGGGGGGGDDFDGGGGGGGGGVNFVQDGVVVDVENGAIANPTMVDTTNGGNDGEKYKDGGGMVDGDMMNDDDDDDDDDGDFNMSEFLHSNND